MADPELEAIRQKRMQELMAQRGGGGGSQNNPEQQKAQEEAKREADERRQMMLSQIMSAEARERLARIALVKPEKARGVEDVVLRAAQMGQIVEKVSEERLISLLEQINTQTTKQTKVTRARELADIIGGDALSLADLSNFHPEDGMILANTTSIGMQPKVDETPISKQALKGYELVFDAVYTPKITRLLREAEESGSKIVTGVEMFIGQAYEQYERFTGLPAPRELFRKIMADH